MDTVRFNGARAFVDATHSLPSRIVVDAAPGQLHSPSTSENVSSSSRRLKSDAPRRRSTVVAAVADSDLKKVAKRRSKARVANVEDVDPDVDVDGLLSESFYARLEAAYGQPSFATLVSDFEAKLGNSEVNERDILRTFGLDLESWPDSEDSAVQDSPNTSNSQAAATTPTHEIHDIASSPISNSGNSLLNDEDIDSSTVELESRPDVENSQPLKSSSSSSRTSTRTAKGSDDVASSSASPTKAVKMSRKRNVEGNRTVKIVKNSVTARPRNRRKTPKEMMNVAPEVSAAPVAFAEEDEIGGKRRLSLRSRIAMRESKQEGDASAAGAAGVDVESLLPEDRDFWSPEADDLIHTYSHSLDLGAPLWGNLNPRLLTAREENHLAVLMKPMKKLQKLHTTLTKQAGKERSDEEWASAADVELPTLRRRMALGQAARMKLIQSNLRLVLSQAYKYHKDCMILSVQDLCQEGVVGLMQAVDRFDPGRGYRFSTYGIYWIRNSILRAQTKSGHMLRSPHNVSTHRMNIKRARQELSSELGRAPTNEEIRRQLGIGADRFRDILRTNMRTSSLHEMDRVTGRERVENFASEGDALSMFARGLSTVQYGLDDVLDSLQPKENLVLRQRYGLDGKGQRSLSEVGLVLNLSREMVRRHELRGILKLQHPTRVEYLRNFLN